MRLITVPEICPVAAAFVLASGPLVAAVARAFVDEVDFTETFPPLSRRRRMKNGVN